MKRRLPLRVLERSTLEDEVYRSVREAILAGELEGKLVQDELAKSLGVSRIPVRAALKRLENEHLVWVDERGGYHAKKIDIDDLREVYSLRALLEGYATRMAVPRIGVEEMAGLRELLKAMAESAGDGDRYVELNVEFHRQIYRVSGQPRLMRMIEGNWSGIPPTTPKTVPGQMERSTAEHEAIVRAIEAGDAQGAAWLLEKHIRDAGERLVAIVLARGSSR